MRFRHPTRWPGGVSAARRSFPGRATGVGSGGRRGRRVPRRCVAPPDRHFTCVTRAPLPTALLRSRP
eukprot:1911768-Prymnesium_polylepis.1